MERRQGPGHAGFMGHSEECDFILTVDVAGHPQSPVRTRVLIPSAADGLELDTALCQRAVPHSGATHS